MRLLTLLAELTQDTTADSIASRTVTFQHRAAISAELEHTRPRGDQWRTALCRFRSHNVSLSVLSCQQCAVSPPGVGRSPTEMLKFSCLAAISGRRDRYWKCSNANDLLRGTFDDADDTLDITHGVL